MLIFIPLRIFLGGIFLEVFYGGNETYYVSLPVDELVTKLSETMKVEIINDGV